MKNNITLFAATAALAFLTSPLIRAQGHHFHYEKAHADLRNAEYTLRGFKEPNVQAPLHKADAAINDAVNAVMKAAAWDHAPDFHTPVDHQFDNKDRFRNALGFLTEARRDVTETEDNPNARKWADVAQRHIDEAIAQTKVAAHALHLDHELGY